MEKKQNLILIFDIYVHGEYKGQKEFKQESVIIGSGNSAHLQIKDAELNSLHAVCNVTDSKVSINDLGGAGISVNGQPISSSSVITTGDEIGLGALKLSLKIIDMGFDAEETTALDNIPNPAEEKTDPTIAEPVVAKQVTSKPSAPIAKPAEAPKVLTEGGVAEDFFETEYNPQENEDALLFVTQTDSISGSDMLEVTQILGEEIADTQYFTPSKEGVQTGSEIGYRLRFAGTPVAWVPKAFTMTNFLMYPFTQAKEEWKSDFYSSEKHELFSWNGTQATLNIPSGWNAQVHENGTTSPLESNQHSLAVGQKIIVRHGSEIYVAQMVKKPKKTYVGILTAIDAGFVGIIATLILFCVISFLFVMSVKDLPPPEEDNIDAVAEFFTATLEIPEESEEEDANEDAGEGAKAKEEEGKVGKEDSKIEQTQGDKIESKDTKEKAVDNFMSGLDFGSAADSGDEMGSSAAMDAFNGGLGGVIGAKGIQAGSGGLGAGGGGLGGGGSADGLGGLGSKGMGRGRSGHGMGGGSFGKKRERGSLGTIGGTPTILGGLDKSLIDAVIKRNMSQIRYCYQRELAKNPSLGGKIKVKFVIAKDGSVSKASIEGSTMGAGGKPVESCIAGRFLKFKFPEPNGGIVIVKYPFIFTGG
jgi:pSer/pThr/pTyr-binding forkhead associated (FHA) protein